MSKSFAQQLEDRGFQSLISNPGDPKGIDGCLERIDAADVIYISNPRGVVGKSVSVDVGYALAKGKPIFATNVISDPPLSHRIALTSC